MNIMGLYGWRDVLIFHFHFQGETPVWQWGEGWSEDFLGGGSHGSQRGQSGDQ